MSAENCIRILKGQYKITLDFGLIQADQAKTVGFCEYKIR